MKLFAALFTSLMLVLPATAAEDKTRLLRDLVIEAGQSANDVTCFACSIRIRGHVASDATAIGGNIVIDGEVAGDAVAVGGSVRLGPRARVEGDAVALGGPVLRDPQAVLGGDPDSLPWFYWPGQRQPYWRGVLALLAFHFGLLLVFFLAARRRRVLRMSAALQHRPWWSLLAGLLMLAFLCLLYYLVTLKVIGTSLLSRYEDTLYWLLTSLLLIVLGFGYAGLACWLGHALRMRSGALAGVLGEAPLPAALAGTLLIVLLELIPLLGSLAFVLFALLALGSATLSVFGTFPQDALGAASPN